MNTYRLPFQGIRLAGWIVATVLAIPGWAADPVAVLAFGEARLHEPLPHRFPLPNPGGDLLEVRAAVPSCDCVAVVEWTPYVEAGGTGSVQVVFTPDRAGEVDYRILVQTSDPQTPEIQFAIRGTVAGGESHGQMARDWSLYLDVEAALAAMATPHDVAWVDVRSEKDHERARIPGSLHIPPYALKTKGFLRSRPVVLVDEGATSPVLEEEVRRLRASGFSNLWIWYGGINAWSQLGGPLEGHDLSSLNRLAPAAVHDLIHSEDWLVVLVGGADGLSGEPVGIPFDSARPGDFAQGLADAIAAQPQTLCVLLATPSGADYAILAPHVSQLDVFIFYLEGGWAAWEQHRQLVGAVGGGARTSSQRIVSTPGGTSRKGGCGGCPK